jgi:hypothetical protein
MLGNGSNPAHGESNARGCSEQLRRGFRPTLIGTSQGCGAAGVMIHCQHCRSLVFTVVRWRSLPSPFPCEQA